MKRKYPPKLGDLPGAQALGTTVEVVQKIPVSGDKNIDREVMNPIQQQLPAREEKRNNMSEAIQQSVAAQELIQQLQKLQQQFSAQQTQAQPPAQAQQTQAPSLETQLVGGLANLNQLGQSGLNHLQYLNHSITSAHSGIEAISRKSFARDTARIRGRFVGRTIGGFSAFAVAFWYFEAGLPVAMVAALLGSEFGAEGGEMAADFYMEWAESRPATVKK